MERQWSENDRGALFGAMLDYLRGRWDQFTSVGGVLVMKFGLLLLLLRAK